MALIDKLKAIGDAIRSKNGQSTKYTLDSMPTAIRNIPAGLGYESATQKQYGTSSKVFAVSHKPKYMFFINNVSGGVSASNRCVIAGYALNMSTGATNGSMSGVSVQANASGSTYPAMVTLGSMSWSYNASTGMITINASSAGTFLGNGGMLLCFY